MHHHASAPGSIASIASCFNKGFVVGKYVRMTRKKSFENILIAGPTGSGKTSHLLIKNIVSLKNCSMIINDPSRELFDKTSGYLQQYFNIQTLNFSDNNISSGYNPMARIKHPSDINKLSDLLVRSTLSGSSDPFWNLQSKNLLTILIKTTLHQAKEYRNFANVRHLANILASDESYIESLIGITKDEQLLLDYKAFSTMPEKTRLNVVASVRAALEMFSDPEIAKVTAYDSIDFDALRKKETVLFIHNSIANMKYLNTLIGIFFEQLYGSLLSSLPDQHTKDLFIILEEASSLYVSSLPIALANTRKYRVGNIICVQSPGQLQSLYPGDAANIAAQCLTKIYLPGHTSIDMMQELVLLSGNMVSIRDIRELPTGRSLILSSNLPLIVGKTAPYFDSLFYAYRSAYPPAHCMRSIPHTAVPLISHHAHTSYESS